MAGAVDTLFLALDGHALVEPDGLWIFLNAQVPLGGVPSQWKDHLVCQQDWRGPHLDLKAHGLTLVDGQEEESSFRGALIVIGKHRGENEAMVTAASHIIGEDATIIIAGDKTAGIGSLRKKLTKMCDVEGSIAKHHATCFWLSNNKALQDFGAILPDAAHGFKTAPGMFSHGKIDVGSALLAGFIDETLRGDIADLGAGWGYLSSEILTKAKPQSLDLYEAHKPSLNAAKVNIDQRAPQVTTAFHWLDITREDIAKKYDAIIMNPPFHTARHSEISLGEQFIIKAAFALKPGGQLLMVANSGLPYERILGSKFRRVDRLALEKGFKVFRAVI